MSSDIDGKEITIYFKDCPRVKPMQQVLVTLEHIKHDIPMRKQHQDLFWSTIDRIVTDHRTPRDRICEYIPAIKMHREIVFDPCHADIDHPAFLVGNLMQTF